MAGRIRDEDIARVRELSPIDAVIGQYLQLRNAGAGQLKGLCPFHEEKSPSFSVSPSKGVFYCLAGETRVLTADGVREIRDLAGGVHKILNRRADWVEAPFRSFGVQPLLKIRLTRNRQVKEIFATPEHRWFVQAGKGRHTTREVVTSDLKKGQALAYTYPGSRIRQSTPSPFGIAHGITYGDGSRNGDGSLAQLDADKDAQLLKWFPQSVVRQYGRQLVVLHLPAYFKALPSRTESVPYLYGWLAGYFAADGCVSKDGTVMLNSARREDLEFVRDVCTRLGIGTYGITEQVREGFPGREPSSLFRVHFVNDDLPEDFFLLDEHRLWFTRTHKAFSRRSWVVDSVEASDREEEVFCAVVDDGHAFVLEDNILTGNCFGCQEHGDVISFVQKMEHLSFSEAIESLARTAGVELHYEQGGAAPGRQSGQRQRLLDANAAAAEFFTSLLISPEAEIGRRFLTERGFDEASWARFGVGYAPTGWEHLVIHLRQKGFSNEDLMSSGLASQGQRGPMDRFRGRLVWPIRDVKGDVVGFGARRLREDDNGPKYLNTPETPLYKKSQVLYGLDLAKGDIARRMQAVVVEGYTDVMACHLAGVTTAVATCGTAFGAEHIQVLRRLLMDQDEFRGRVIFTFDGDEAGRRAALKAFKDEQRFVTQTFVAVQPDGLDPCDLRQQRGDGAVRDLVASHVPLAEFAIRSEVDRHDLDIPEGRIAALVAAAPVVATLKDWSLRDEYGRRLAGWLGMDVDSVIARVREIASAPQRSDPGQQPGRTPRAGVAEQPRRAAPTAPATRPDPDDPRLFVEREVSKLAVQRPALAGPTYDALDAVCFTHPAYTAVRAAVLAAGGAAGASGGIDWVTKVLESAADDGVRALVTELAVEPLKSTAEDDPRYAESILARVQELAITRQIAELKSRLQRVNPIEQADDYNRLFGDLVVLEAHKRGLREQAIGAL